MATNRLTYEKVVAIAGATAFVRNPKAVKPMMAIRMNQPKPSQERRGTSAKMQPSYVTEEHRDYKQRRSTGQQFQARSKPRVFRQAGTRGEFRTEGTRQLPQDDHTHAKQIEPRP